MSGETDKVQNKILVAYYSWSGVTEKAAREIAATITGDTYQIVPQDPYPSVYALCVAKAGMEKASGARPPIAGELPDIGNYTKIAVGFPIWWFSCPMIIHSFLAKLDLKDKKVYLFCTSKSSGPKNSAQDIRDKLPGVTVGECLDIRKPEALEKTAIRSWLEEE